MSNFNFDAIPYISSHSLEKIQGEKDIVGLDAWLAQRIVFEILENHLLTNDPKDLGFGFSQRYNKDPEKSQIFIDISHNWKACSPQKRPAVYIYRGEADYGGRSVIGQRAFMDVAESTEGFITHVQLPIMLNCIAEPIGFAEEFANYIKYPFVYFWKNIQCEYGFTKFRLSSISPPEHFDVDAKDSFSIKLTLSTEFYDKWAVQQDALKLKTVSTEVMMDIMEKPLDKQ